MAIISGIKIFGSGAKPPVLEELNATSNGTYTPSDGVDGYNPVNVNVQPNLQAKSTTTTITSNGTSTITLEPDSNYDGLSSASVTITTNVESSGGNTPKIYIKDGTKLCLADNNGEVSDLSNISPIGLTDMSSLFSNSKTTGIKISGWDTSNVERMERTFWNCSNLTSIDISSMNTSKVTITDSMFRECTALTNINMKGCNLTNVTNVNNMFRGCTALTELRFTDYGDESWSTESGDLPKMDLTNWGLEDCVNLSYDSLKSIIWSLNVEYSGTCRIGSINLAKLTDEDIAQATEYGWTLQ